MVQHWLVHPDSGVRCPRPEGWSTLGIRGAGVAAVEPAQSGAPRSSLVLTVVDNGGLTFAQWQARSDRVLPLVLRDYELIDLQKCRVGTADGGQRVARHLSVDGSLLVLRQWFCAVGGLGVTVSATGGGSSPSALRPWAQEAADGLIWADGLRGQRGSR